MLGSVAACGSDTGDAGFFDSMTWLAAATSFDTQSLMTNPVTGLLPF